MFDDLKNIQGKTIESVIIGEYDNAEIIFTDGTSVIINGNGDWVTVKFKETEHVNVH